MGNLAAISWIVDPDSVVEGEPEPLFVTVSQSRNRSAIWPGGLSGLALMARSGATSSTDLEDGGEGETQAQPPVVMPRLEPSAE